MQAGEIYYVCKCMMPTGVVRKLKLCDCRRSVVKFLAFASFFISHGIYFRSNRDRYTIHYNIYTQAGRVRIKFDICQNSFILLCCLLEVTQYNLVWHADCFTNVIRTARNTKSSHPRR